MLFDEDVIFLSFFQRYDDDDETELKDAILKYAQCEIPSPSSVTNSSTSTNTSVPLDERRPPTIESTKSDLTDLDMVSYSFYSSFCTSSYYNSLFVYKITHLLTIISFYLITHFIFRLLVQQTVK